MSLNKLYFTIGPRYVKQGNDGMRPFQKELTEAIFNKKEKIIILEAPVGVGKTFSITQLLGRKEFERRPIVLTYPTKILMESQISSFKKEMGKTVRIWPWENFKGEIINIFIYSTDTLVESIKRKRITDIHDRGELIYRLLTDLEWHSKYGAIVTSPDVLYLLIQGKYKKSNRILNLLQNSLLIFDEFHCYYGLETFITLLDKLLSKIADKIILLSATPLKSERFKKLEDKYGICNISFRNSIGSSKDKCFNYELEVCIDSFRLTKLEEMENKLKEILPHIPKPCAVIFDSIFRLRHISKNLQNNRKLAKVDFKEWSGMKKERRLKINNKTIILSTSAIEVGIDMNFKSLIFEASYWPSAIQRLGRVGRKEKGIAVILTRKDFYPYLKNKVNIERAEFEEILKSVLKEPKEEIGDGYSFRGRSFNFILLDEVLKETFIYNENLFAMYEINDYVDDWRNLTMDEKRNVLKEFGVNPEKIEDILLYDKVVPFWGVLKGNLKDEYEYSYKEDMIFPTENRNELHIKGYVFYGK